MSAYSPFDKELKDLEPADLAVLREVVEGWYIEYKADVPNASSVAKSLSAFANTHGGWLFYGIQEKSKEDLVAGCFPGIARCDVDASLQRVRQAATTQLNPSPHFDIKVIRGPCETIGLLEDRAVVCIWVPWSHQAPHVHASGRIYRRVADGSEPKPEHDRFVLDQLWHRADDLRQQYVDLVNRDPEFSEWEKERPYVRLLLVADLWRDRDTWVDASLEELRGILSDSHGIWAVPFDTVYPSANGLIARQLQNNDSANLSLTWRFSRNFVSDVIIPLNVIMPSNLSKLRSDLSGYDGTDSFVETLSRCGHTSPRIVDLNFLFNVLIGIAETQQRLMAVAGWTEAYFVWQSC
jgi:Putative DNA-binding domain